MNAQQQTAILQAAIQHYGHNHQLLKCCEESGELVQALVKFIANPTEQTRHNLLDECADMNVTLRQVEIMCPYIAANIAGRVEHKLDRLADMIAEEKCNGNG